MRQNGKAFFVRVWSLLVRLLSFSPVRHSRWFFLYWRAILMSTLVYSSLSHQDNGEKVKEKYVYKSLHHSTLSPPPHLLFDVENSYTQSKISCMYMYLYHLTACMYMHVHVHVSPDGSPWVV